MLNYEKTRIEKAVKTINSTVNRVLIADCYEGYELRTLKAALQLPRRICPVVEYPLTPKAQESAAKWQKEKAPPGS